MLIGVTGGSGFIGEQLVTDLLAAGHAVRVLSRNPDGMEKFSWQGQVQIAKGSLQQPRELASFCFGCDAIIHLAALAHITNTTAQSHEQGTLAGTVNLLQTIRAEKVNNLIYISSIKASLSPEASAYAQAKAASEERVKESSKSGLNSLILRPAIVYGPGMKGNLAGWMRKIRQGRAPRLPKTGTTLQMIGREDLCQAIILGLSQMSTAASIYTLTDGHSYGINDIERALHKVLNVPMSSIVLPRWCWWSVAKAADTLFRITGKSLGFSTHSYRTLFCQEALATDGLPGFSAVTDLYQQLPQILSAMHDNRR